MTLPFVSVVIPTYRRPDLLERCLNAVLEQDYPRSSYEIIVVDDAADLNTRDLVQKLAQKEDTYILWPNGLDSSASQNPGNSNGGHTLAEPVPGKLVRVNVGPSVRYIPVTGEHGPAIARNKGWQAASGQIIAFTDDDTVPSPGWLRSGVASFKKQTVGVSGKIIMPIPIIPTDYQRDASGLERSAFVTANCFYRRTAIESVGGFDSKFKIAWREDTDLYFTMLENGFELGEAPDAIVVHPIRNAGWGISLKQQGKSKYNALLYKKHPKLYREKVQPKPPLLYYAIVIACVASLILLLFGALQAAAITASFWGGLTLAFFTHRLRGTVHSWDHVIEMAITSFVIPFLSVYWRLYGAISYRTWFF